MSTRHTRAAMLLLAAAQELLAAAEQTQCDCSPAERECGHRVSCLMPVLQAALMRAARLPNDGSAYYCGSPQVEKLVQNFLSLPAALQPYILYHVKEIRKLATNIPGLLGSAAVPMPMEDLTKLRAWERDLYRAIEKQALAERARVASLHDLEE